MLERGAARALRDPHVQRAAHHREPLRSGRPGGLDRRPAPFPRQGGGARGGEGVWDVLRVPAVGAGARRSAGPLTPRRDAPSQCLSSPRRVLRLVLYDTTKRRLSSAREGPRHGAGANPKGKFVLHREEIKCVEAMLAREDYKSAAEIFPPSSGPKSTRLFVFQSHGDQVLALPPGAEALASSDTADIEVWALGEDVLAWQGHPELSAEAMITKITPYIRQLSADERAAAKSSFQLGEAASHNVRPTPQTHAEEPRKKRPTRRATRRHVERRSHDRGARRTSINGEMTSLPRRVRSLI